MFTRAALFLAFLSTLTAATDSAVFPLKRLVLANSEAAAVAVKPSDSSARIVYTESLPLLASADFEATIRPFIDQPIGGPLLAQLTDAIGKYARAHDRLITRVMVPTQSVSDGTLRLVVVFGRFADVAVRGNRWFSSRLLEERLGIKPGDEVRLSVLESAVNWTNTNPFRHVQVLVNPLENQPGKANLVIGVQDVKPWRFSTSIDNYGTDVLGNWHYSAAVQAGNLWGLDHQGSYQFITTDDLNLYQAHVLSYRIPLSWRHFIDVTAYYSRVNAVFGNTNQFTQTGRNGSVSARYTVPIQSGDNPVEVHAGVDFKRGNNNLEYGGVQVRPTNADTIQLTTGGSMVRHDRFGGTAISATLNLSPGNLDSSNSRKAYEQARLGADPSYTYAALSVQRLLELPKGWQLSSRATAQVASTNLIGSEEFTIGGPTSVRGFTSNIYAGDNGFVFNNDLLTPTLKVPLNRVAAKLPPMNARFAVFYDAGQVWLNQRFASDLPMRPLASVGVGLRLDIANNFSLNFDYGWQKTRIPDVYRANERGKGHLKVTLAF